MEKYHNEFTEEESLKQETGVNEEKINPYDLAAEICPLLEDYFCGSFEKNTKGVVMKMDNGQIFQLTVEVVA